VRLDGRERDVSSVLALLDRGHVVSLWGAPGIGKSFVALAVAEAWRARGGQIVAKPPKARSKRDTLVLIDADGADAPLLPARAGATAVLVVARGRIEAAEAHVELEALGVPAENETAHASPAAVVLQRAAEAAGSTLDLGGPAVSRLVRMLGGVPLSLVSAAPRLSLLGPAGLLSRLERGEPLAPVVHDALASSWARLPVDARQALSRLSLFDASFSGEALEAVVRDVTGDPLGVAQVLRHAGLLARGAETSDQPVFTLLPPVRAFARLELSASGQLAAAERAHSLALAALPREALDAVRLAELDRAIDAYAEDDGTRARLFAARGRAWSRHGVLADALGDFERAIRLLDDEDGLRPQVLVDMGIAHHQRRDLEAAGRCYGEALDAFRRTRDRRGEGRAIANLGALAHDLGELVEALGHYRQALALFSAIGEDRLAAVTLSNLGVLEQEWGMAGEARQHFERAIDLAARAGDPRFEGITRGNLGSLLAELGSRAEARTFFSSALALARTAGDHRTEALCLARLGGTLAADDAIEDASRALDDADAIAHRTGDAVAKTTVHVHRAFLDLALARRARLEGRTSAAETHEAAARARAAPSDSSQFDLPDDARTALRMLAPLLDPGSRGDDELVVGPDAQYFQVRGGTPQDLASRRPLRAMLGLLVDRHERNDPPATIDDLREASWPGERMQQSAAVNRVQVAIAELRRRGLKGDLVREAEGYRLSPSLRIRKLTA
jgi:tetratricopeptide (TPR) repeat protein